MVSSTRATAAMTASICTQSVLPCPAIAMDLVGCPYLSRSMIQTSIWRRAHASYP
ncbi:hypothetical protein M3J09_002835 [Ascochyta lentis]